MLDGFSRFSYKQLGGLVTCMPPERVPLGSATQVRNCKFLPNSVRPRDGLTLVWQVGSAAIKGLGELVLQDADNTYLPLVYAADGVLYIETLVGTNSLQIVASGLPVDAFACFTGAYGREYIGFGDRVAGTGAPKQYYKYQGGVRFRGLSPAGNASAATGTEKVVSGDVLAGDRYAVVFFETETGYKTAFTDAAVFLVSVTTDNHQIRISEIPIGPAGTVARWVAFTASGGSSAGPFYTIAENETLQEANAPFTSTFIDDNSTTTVVFNFTDELLQSDTDVSAFFEKIAVPNCGGVRFLPSIRRMAYYGIADMPSTVVLSDPDDPETVYALLSYLQVAENDGQRVQCPFEFRNTIYVAKEHSGHVVTEGTGTDDATPSAWKIQKLWDQVGPCGPDALDVCDEFVAFASIKGLYKFDGGGSPEWISWEHSQDAGLWAQINWKYGHKISVTVDSQTKRILVSVPLGQSVECSHILTCDYSNGFAQPVQANPINGVLMSIRGRRWSLDDIATNKVLRMQRPLVASPNPNQPGNNLLAQTQLLFASSAADGAVNMQDITSTTDNTQAIACYYQPSFIQPGGLYTLGAVTLDVKGAGNVVITGKPNPDQNVQFKDMFVDSVSAERTIKTRGTSNNWSVCLQPKSPGDWFDVGEIVLWLASKWETQVEGR